MRGLESQVYEEKQSYATGTAYQKTVTRTWDAMGNKKTEAYPSGLSLTYAWTDVDQLASIADGTSTIAAWTHGGLRRKQIDYQNGTKTLLAYTGFRGEVGTIHHKDSGNATLLQLDYGYDKLHDRTLERYGGSGAAGDAFAYDRARRLTTAWMGSVTPTTPTTVAYTKKIEYAMDDDGNRTSVAVTPYGSSATTTSYTTNSLNQYTAVGGTSRSHDGNGNVASDGTYAYEYNYKNLICRVKQGSTTIAEYRYDALGRRVEKAVTGATYRYVYSGVETVSVYTSTGTWKQDYVYDDTIDGVVMLAQADVLDQDGDSNTSETTRSFYHRNALGSVMAITDMSQAVAVSYRYDPYGNITITHGGTTQTSDPLGQCVTYTGRWHDEETGLYHYRARTYDPLRGRFLQRDPMGLQEGLNLFLSGGSCPLSTTDPLGEFGLSDALRRAVEAAVPGGLDRAWESMQAAAAWDRLDECAKQYYRQNGGAARYSKDLKEGHCPEHSRANGPRLHPPGVAPAPCIFPKEREAGACPGEHVTDDEKRRSELARERAKQREEAGDSLVDAWIDQAGTVQELSELLPWLGAMMMSGSSMGGGAFEGPASKAVGALLRGKGLAQLYRCPLPPGSQPWAYWLSKSLPELLAAKKAGEVGAKTALKMVLRHLKP